MRGKDPDKNIIAHSLQEISLTSELLVKNLNFGPCSKCNEENCSCSSKKGPDLSSSSSPYFWRRTLNNPIAKKQIKPPGSILNPPKLKLALDSALKSDQIVSKPKERIPPLPPSSSSSSSIHAQESSSSSAFILDPDVFIPDLSKLSLGSPELDLRLLKALQIETKMPNISSNRLRRFKQLKWKRRMKISLRDSPPSPTLPTISEEEESGEENNEAELTKMQTCGQQASASGGIEPVVDDVTIDELAAYLADGVFIPKPMSVMAEMMYT